MSAGWQAWLHRNKFWRLALRSMAGHRPLRPTHSQSIDLTFQLRDHHAEVPMPVSRRLFLATVGAGGAGVLTRPFISWRGHEMLVAQGVPSRRADRLLAE